MKRDCVRTRIAQQETPYWNTAGMSFAFVLLSAVVLALVLVPASMLRVKAT